MQEKYELEQLMELVQTKQFRKLRSILMEMNEVDVAEFLDELGPEETILVFRLLPKEQAAEVFADCPRSRPPRCSPNWRTPTTRSGSSTP